MKIKTNYDYDCVILESTMESNKPIPILIFCDSLINVKEYTDQKNINDLKFDDDSVYIQGYTDKFIFTINKEIINRIGETSNRFSDTFTLAKSHFIYAISLISNKRKITRYVNTQEQLKNLFDNLDNILKTYNLSYAIDKINSVRRQIW